MKSSRFILPRSLPPGGTIGIFSPSGAPDAAKVERGIARLTAKGYRCVVADYALGSHEYFSAPDEVRLTSFHAMLRDPAIDMMMMSRGGYGLSRIVHLIDWQAVAVSGKLFCGFSDFTAFNLAALKHCSFITLTGAGVATDFGEAEYLGEWADGHQFMAEHFFNVIGGNEDSVTVESDHPYAPSVIEGSIWGSNLSLLSHAVGTPLMPDIAGGILFVEEIAEEPYAIERMFLQLYHAGVLQTQRAVVLGQFSDCEPSSGRFAYTMAHVVKTLRQLLPCPVLTDLPFGHVAKKLCIPFGADATLTIRQDQYQLAY